MLQFFYLVFLIQAFSQNIYFENAIGDFIAIASESNKAILTKGNSDLISMHGGNSDREIYVPLIAYYKD